MENFFERGLVASIFLYAVTLPISISATNCALALMLFFFVLLWTQKKFHCFVPISLFCILLFFLWATITCWLNEKQWSISSLSSFSKVWNLLPYIMIPLVSKIIGDKVGKVLRVLAAVASLVVLLGLIQYLTGIHYFFEGWLGSHALVNEKRFYGFQSHPLHSGGLYMILFLAALGLALFYRAYPDRTILSPVRSPKNLPVTAQTFISRFFHTKTSNGVSSGEAIFNSREKIFWGFASAILGCGVLLTFSRSYYLALALGLLILFSARGHRFLLTHLAVASIFFFFVVLLSPQIRERVKTIHPYHTDESGRQRIYIWKSALSMIREHPVVGVGYGNWGKELTGYAARFPDWKMDSAALGHAHNSYLTVASETGWIGLALFLLFWVFLLKEEFIILRRSKKWSFFYTLSLGIIATIFSLMVAGLFEHNLLTATISLSLFFVIGLARVTRESEQQILSEPRGTTKLSFLPFVRGGEVG